MDLPTILAQAEGKVATDPTAQFWVTMFSGLGVLTILVWFLYHQTSVAGPAKDKEHREAMREMHTEHTVAMKEISKEHEDTIRALVSDLKEDREKDRQARREDYAQIASRFKCEGSG